MNVDTVYLYFSTKMNNPKWHFISKVPFISSSDEIKVIDITITVSVHTISFNFESHT